MLFLRVDIGYKHRVNVIGNGGTSVGRGKGRGSGEG